MGVGSALMSVFGGGNDYKYTMPPTMGPPRRPGQSAEDYQKEQYDRYANQAANAQAGIAQAGNRNSLPANLLNFKDANQTLGLQQGLAQQLLAQGRGEGPNPAMDQLRMTTDQNAKQAAGMAASQRGINPALAARIAAQGVAGANQQAAGQGALMSAQQQLGAQQAAGGLLGNISGQQIGMSTAQGQAGLGLLQQNAYLENLRRQAELERQNQINSVYGNANAINAGVSAQNASTAGQYGMAGMMGLSSAIQGAATMNKGGEVPNPFLENVMRKNYAMGGGVDPSSFYSSQMGNAMTGVEDYGRMLQKSMAKTGASVSLPGQYKKLKGVLGMGGEESGVGDFNTGAGSSSGGGAMAMMALVSKGGKIGGKAKVKGDSETNDVVPAMLSPGEVVIPRSAMGSPEDAHAFLDKIIRKHDGPDYKSVIEAKAHYHNMAHGGDMATCMSCGGYV